MLAHASKRTARETQRHNTLHMRTGRAANLLGYTPDTLTNWCKQGWLQDGFVVERGVKQFHSEVIYRIRDNDRIWRIATGIQEGRLDAEDQIYLSIARRTATESLKEKHPVALIQLAELLGVTPGTVYAWVSKSILRRRKLYTITDFDKLCAHIRPA